VHRFIKEVLVPLKCNKLVLNIGYRFQYTSHKELKTHSPWSKEQIREVADICRENGITLIPLINCLGHQNWSKYPPYAMLKAHPEFEEKSEIPVTSKDFYCRSWCPLHPEVNKVVFELMDELIDATQSKYFHVGMDEVFVIASKKCPRCKGKDPAELFAKAANDYYDHLTKKRGVRMMMWGDRLLNGESTGYGAYAGSANGTEGAIDLIPKDIIITDWHYDSKQRKRYPSLRIFTEKGFTIWPAVFDAPLGAMIFQAQGQAMKSDKVLGILCTHWSPLEGYAYKALGITPPASFKPPDPNNIGRLLSTVRIMLGSAWNPGKKK
jgi:hypothetical protein